MNDKHQLIKIILLSVFTVLSVSIHAATGKEGVHCSVATDQDGDEVILMESEWISMQLLPRMQAIVNRFVFRPTGNDIEEVLQPKIRKLGGGILMDCFWEQDWRFQELAEKPYKYKVTKNGPDEAQVVFETDIVGWVGSDRSGVISKLLSNMILRRTVTLKAGQPFFRFDFEFINQDKNAKRPTFWVHNSSCVDPVGMESVLRPSSRAIMEIKGLFRGEAVVKTPDYIRDFNQGWSTRIARHRREGIIYLMDYDYIKMLYNCGNTTSEWMYDSILSFHNKPWKGRVYILPIIGLSGVDYANEYFICQMKPSKEPGKLMLEYLLTSSYEKVAKVTLNTELEYNLLPDNGKNKKVKKLKPVSFDGLNIQPSRQVIEIPFDGEDPLVFNVKAYMELSDGSMKTCYFQYYYTGDYDSGQGINTRLEGDPVRLLERRIQRPEVPQPSANLSINKKAVNVFAVLGLGSHRMKIPEAIESIPNGKMEAGYCTGQDAYGYALGDFPYDYERLFDFRVLVLANTQQKEFRAIGASILQPWLKAGGGMVISGGEHAFNFEFREHPINQYLPIVPRKNNLVKGSQQLKPPEPAYKNHPIFKGIDFSNLPWLEYCHDIKIKKDCNAKVLMKVGDYPFIVEKETNGQRTIVVANNHFGVSDKTGKKTVLRDWSEWPKLYANIVRYAAGDLK